LESELYGLHSAICIMVYRKGNSYNYSATLMCIVYDTLSNTHSYTQYIVTLPLWTMNGIDQLGWR